MSINVTQITKLRIETNGKVIDLICDSDTPLGSLHDALMQFKGWTVERMTKVQKDEEGTSEMMKAKSDEVKDPQP